MPESEPIHWHTVIIQSMPVVYWSNIFIVFMIVILRFPQCDKHYKMSDIKYDLESFAVFCKMLD